MKIKLFTGLLFGGLASLFIINNKIVESQKNEKYSTIKQSANYKAKKSSATFSSEINTKQNNFEKIKSALGSKTDAEKLQDVIDGKAKLNSNQLNRVSYSSDDISCSEDTRKKRGFSYQYKRKSKDLLKGKKILHKAFINEAPILNVLFDEDNTGKTNFRILDNGLASLYSRLDLIDKAKKSIELEYFIYRIREKKNLNKVASINDFLKAVKTPHINSSTVIITQALMKKALQGVKVRVLIDASGTILDFKEDLYTASHIKLREMAKEAKVRYDDIKGNFEFRYYNNVPTARVSTVNFRNHRKLFLVDDKYGMTGGRNIEDKYFDMDPYYNFHDRDVLVTYNGDHKESKILQSFRNSFDSYWNQANTSETIEFLDGVNPSTIGMKAVHANAELKTPFLIMNKDYTVTRNEIMRKGKHNYDISTTERACKKATFVSDRSINKVWYKQWLTRANSYLGFTRYKERYRFAGRIIEEKIIDTLASGKKNILLSSPYFSLNCRTKILAEKMSSANAEVEVFTNSLTSTDAVYNAALFYARAQSFAKDGANLFVHSSKALPRDGYQYMTVMNAEGKRYSALESRWGLHSKSHVYGDDKIYIGTFNIDNRSSFYNSEMGVFCEDTPELAKELRDLTEARMQLVSGTKLDLDKSPGAQLQLVGKDPVNLGKRKNPHGDGAEKGETDFMYDIFKYVEKGEILF